MSRLKFSQIRTELGNRCTALKRHARARALFPGVYTRLQKDFANNRNIRRLRAGASRGAVAVVGALIM